MAQPRCVHGEAKRECQHCNAPTNLYGSNIRAYMYGRKAAASQRFGPRDPRDVQNEFNHYKYALVDGTHLTSLLEKVGKVSDRDTLALGKESSFRRVLLGLQNIDQDILIGRDVEAEEGMLVYFTKEAVKRRNLARKVQLGPTSHHWAKNSSENDNLNDVGRIIKVNGNWTCDVQWQQSNDISRGCCCGGQGGKFQRAYHLALFLPPQIKKSPNRLNDKAIQKLYYHEFGKSCKVLR
eukprot:766638-Hanusia_phi.AAC.8